MNFFVGMFQRLDKLRKIAFASVCLFGTDNDSTISGVWVWEGQDLAFEVRSLFVCIPTYFYKILTLPK